MTTRDLDINIFHLAPSFQRKKVLLEIESPAGPSYGAAVTAKDNPPLTLTFLSPPLQKAESGRRGNAKRAAVDPTTSGDGSLRQAPFVPLAHKRTREKSQSYLVFFCLFVCLFFLPLFSRCGCQLRSPIKSLIRGGSIHRRYFCLRSHYSLFCSACRFSAENPVVWGEGGRGGGGVGGG